MAAQRRLDPAGVADDLGVTSIARALADRWGAPTAAAPAPTHATVPADLRDVWAAVGLAGFGSGRLWLTDPAEWQPAVDAWTDGDDGWLCVSRNAFGTLRLWRAGEVRSIHPVRGWVVPAAGLTLADALCSRDPDDVDLFDPDDRPLFERALARLGPTAADTVYGGGPTLADLALTPAVAHVTALAATTRRVPFPDVTG